MADRATLIRRLSFDLRGLPPSEEDLRAFTEDTRQDPWSPLVDQMLASPHFGERLGGTGWISRVLLKVMVAL